MSYGGASIISMPSTIGLLAKPCPSCQETKPIDEFYRCASKPDGRAIYCKLCAKAKAAAYYRANPDKVKANVARWQAENPDRTQVNVARYRVSAKAKATKSAWNDLHRDQRRAHAKARYAQFTDEYKQRARAHYERTRAEDPEKLNERYRVWAKANPDKTREAQRRRRTRVRGSKTFIVPAALVALKMAYWGSRCWMCHGPFEQVDHVKPVAKGGPHMLANLRPACRSCNLKKRDHWPWPTSSKVSAQP